ncbi:MAG: DUF6340 family protein [Bacteroidales bacterium]|nr:DUF6340 family protein [Bacteroidales bacterium]
MEGLKRTFYIWMPLLLLTGCFASRSYVSFEVLDPAGITYPESVDRVAFMNRSPVAVQYAENIKNQKIDPVTLQIIDTIVGNNLRKGFSEGIRQADIAYLDDMPLINYRRMDTLKLSEPLDPVTLERIFELNNVDALVSLENYGVTLYRSYRYYSFENLDYTYEYTLILDVLWRVYERNAGLLDERNRRDTLYYYNYSDMNPSDYWSNATVLRDGSLEAGFRYGITHVPVWLQVSRILYRGGEKGLVTAAEHADRGEWDAAAEIWDGLTGHESPRIAAKALHNLAIHYELMDDMEAALAASGRALALWDNEEIRQYNRILKKRMTDQEKLMQQVR